MTTGSRILLFLMKSILSVSKRCLYQGRILFYANRFNLQFLTAPLRDIVKNKAIKTVYSFSLAIMIILIAIALVSIEQFTLCLYLLFVNHF